MHPNPLTSNPDDIQYLTGVFNALSGPDISVELAGPLHAAENIDAVRTLFKGSKQVDDIYLASTGNLYYFYVYGVL